MEVVIIVHDKIKFRILSIFAIIFLCIGLTYRVLQNDTFYIIKLGEDIVKNGIDLLDHYSWVADLEYTYPHWLYDVIIYLIYNVFDYIGVYISVIICFIFFGLCIYFVHLKMHKNEFIAFFVAAITCVPLSMFAVARSQIISLPLFLLEVYSIDRLIKTGQNRYIIYLCILSLIIANTHATTWLFYFVLFLPFIGEHIVYKVSQNRKVRKIYKLDKYKNSKVIIKEIKNLNKVIVGLVLSFLMGIFTPSRICYSYVFRVMLGNSQKLLLEHLPLVVIENPFFIFTVILLVIILINNKSKIYLRELFMICGLLVMALISTRHLVFFYTIGVLYVTILSLRCLSNIGDKSLDILYNLIVKNKFIYVVVFIVIIGYSGYNFYLHSDEKYVLKEEYPVGAVKYINKNLEVENMRLYNNYNYGSYLLFNDIPVFIDSRCDLYLKEFNGMDYSIFDELVDIEFDYEEKFEYFDVTHVLLDKKSVLYMIILKDINYEILYEDDDFILFKKLDN
ncbi:MAG: hypothetical protein IJ509_03075 [Bacilli bacterium]|nr:hypothetical protein [Bacilli bacterium]